MRFATAKRYRTSSLFTITCQKNSSLIEKSESEEVKNILGTKRRVSKDSFYNNSIERQTVTARGSLV